MIQRFGRSEGLSSLILPATVYFSIALVILTSMWPYFYYIKNETLIVLGIFSIWRYSWQLIHYSRSIWYGFIRYPKLKKLALNNFSDENYPEHIFFVIPSYNEEPWVSVESIQSIMSNLTQIPSSATLIVATGSNQDDLVISSIYKAHPARHKVELVFQRQEHGKRIAMGHALRAVARRYKEDINSVTIFMDGDSYLESNTLSRTVPFFSKFQDLGALTTNEVAYINTTSHWYKDWFNLKFGQRHILFQSHSLSNKVLTLTGRFSIFRTNIVVNEEFICLIENDMLTHWLHGKFRFLMGDDKSSWYYLLKQGWNMLYIPDVLVYSLESRDADFWELSTSLPFRWYGNTLRNNARALKLGAKKTGVFIWLTILDQRLSMWTALVGISGALFLSFTKSFIYLPFYIAWILLVRILQMSIIAIRGHPVSLLTIPLMLYNQWVGSIIKIRAFFHLGEQKWSKGGEEQATQNRYMVNSRLAAILPTFIHISSFCAFFFALAISHNAVNTPRVWVFNTSSIAYQINAAKFGVIPNDGIDDSGAINQIIASIQNELTVIQLPSGIIDIHEPIIIDKSNIILRGSQNSHLVATFLDKFTNKPVIQIHGKQSVKLKLDKQQALTQYTSTIKKPFGLSRDDVVLFTLNNSEDFFNQIDSKVWRKKYPVLRRQLNRINQVDGNKVTFDYPIDKELITTKTSLQLINVINNVGVEDLIIEYIVPNKPINTAQFIYENLYPNHKVDTVSLKWTDNISLKNLTLLNAGSDPISIENSLACTINSSTINGAWNKGIDGNGYLKLSKTHHCKLQNLTVKGIRHIAIQWGSSHNSIEQLYSEVDVNFHGGYSHNNQISDIYFSVPKAHPWPKIYRTPNDAHWASPDGKNNLVN